MKEISDPPKQLWGEGMSDCLSDETCVAVVGARECTPYGEKTAFDLSKGLAEAGVVVVSGLAYGIDTAAHRGALAGCGKTIAVLGCGIDIPYPAENLDLKKQIAGSGAVITELEPGTRGTNWTFPKRNRIISGLSRGVVVVEAAVKSGALITADLALQQGREVFAVPGNIGSLLSGGTNRLIQQGAKLVATVRDILEELNLASPQRSLGLENRKKTPEILPDTPEGKILSLLSNGPRHVDELVDLTQISVQTMSEILVRLEIDGKINSLPGSRFVRNEA